MKIACLGGGPAGLYFAISMKLRDAAHDITVFERNRPDDTFGWGVVLSDETLANLAGNDPVSAAAIRDNFAYWDDIAVNYRGERIVSTGHGFCGIGRRQLLLLLQERARALGVNLRFETEIDGAAGFAKAHDLVVAADGLNSKVRNEFAAHFRPDIDLRKCKFVWLGTRQKFDDAFTFIFEETEHGWIWAHAYQFDADTATFIVECSEATWDRFGFGTMSSEESIATCERIFAKYLGGHHLMSNARHLRGSGWLNFPRVLCEKWSHGNIVLMGDAAATAHFSIGSGTKLAMESAISLADYSAERAEHRRGVRQIRGGAAHRGASPAIGGAQFARMVRECRALSRPRSDPVQLFAADALAAHQPRESAAARQGLARIRRRLVPASGREQQPDRAAADVRAVQAARHDAQEPRRRLADGAIQGRRRLPDRLALRALCRARQGRRRPRLHRDDLREPGGADHAGLHRHVCAGARGRLEAHRRFRARRDRGQDLLPARAFRRRRARPSSAGKRWTRRSPTATGRCIAASDVPWSPRNQHPKAMDRADMDRVRDEFVAAAQMADRAGFDMLELHCAHGYLLSSFITPLTNRRTDDYGGSLENRMRYPLEVFAAVRAVWPADKPISVRISASDWVGDDGIEPNEAVEIARLLQEAGVDICDVSAGQTSIRARPVYGRMFQTPFSDRIRNEAGMATMAVGNIYEPDHVNSILMAGRADLVCLARPHLADPYWTLHAAARLGDRGEAWPAPYYAGRDQLYRLAEQAEAATTSSVQV